MRENDSEAAPVGSLTFDNVNYHLAHACVLAAEPAPDSAQRFPWTETDVHRTRTMTVQMYIHLDALSRIKSIARRTREDRYSDRTYGVLNRKITNGWNRDAKIKKCATDVCVHHVMYIIYILWVPLRNLRQQQQLVGSVGAQYKSFPKNPGAPGGSAHGSEPDRIRNSSLIDFCNALMVFFFFLYRDVMKKKKNFK